MRYVYCEGWHISIVLSIVLSNVLINDRPWLIA